MVTFSQARFGEVDAQITGPDNRLVPQPDRSIAQAIESFGQLGGQARRGSLKRELKGEIRESGNIIGTINAGEEAIQDAVRKGQIDPTTDKFKRLAAASEQGRISQQRAALEAEVLLRQSISMAPGFATQLRQTARDTLGFDPTAGALNTLFLSGPDADSTRVTQEMKDMEQAQQLQATGYVDTVQEGLRLVVGARAAEFQEKIDDKRIKDGKVNAPKIAHMGAKRAERGANSFMLEAMKQIKTTGAIQDTQSLKNGMIAQRQQDKLKMERQMMASTEHLYVESDYENMRNRIDSVYEANMEMLDNQDVVKVLGRHQEKLESIMSITSIAIAPHLAVMSQFGESAVSGWIELMAASNGDPRVMEELIKVNPEFKFLSDLDLDNNQLIPGLQAAAQGALGASVDRGDVDGTTADAIARYNAARLVGGQDNPSDGALDTAHINLVDRGKTQTALSTLANTTDSYVHANEKTRADATQNFRVSQQQQVANVSQRLAQRGLGLSWDGQRFVVQDPEARPVSEVSTLSQVGGTMAQMGGPTPGGRRFEREALAREAGVSEQLDFINNTMLPLAKDRRWAKEFGYEDANDWANSLMNSVNMEAARTDLSQDDGLISQRLGMADQAQLRDALREGNVDQAIDILSQAKLAGQDIDDIENAAMFESDGEFQQTGQGEVEREGQQAGQAQIELDGSQIQGLNQSVQFDNEFHAEVATLEGMHTMDKYRENNTVGFGRDLGTNPLGPEDYAFLGLDVDTTDEQVAQHLVDNPELARDLMIRDLDRAQEQITTMPTFTTEDGVDINLPSIYNNLDPERQQILNNMAYQMGADGLSDFENMLTELQKPESNRIQVALHMMDSKWARKDSPRRAKILAARMSGIPVEDFLEAARSIRAQRG